MSEGNGYRPTIDDVRNFVWEALRSFTGDPPDSDFQRGYLHALYVVGIEALNLDLDPVEHLPTDPEFLARPRQVPHLRLVK